MKLLVIGARGAIGENLVCDALAAGHTITAFSRNAQSLGVTHGRLSKRDGDVLSAAQVGAAFDGIEAVCVAIGRPKGAGEDFYARAAANVIAAMHDHGVSRYVGISAGGMHTDENDGPLRRHLLKPVVAAIFRHEYRSLGLMEAVLHESRVQWTLIVPPRLLDGPKRGGYRTSIDRNVRGGAAAITRASVADAMLRSLEDKRTFGHLVFVG